MDTDNRLAREAGLEYVEIQNLTEFFDDNRYVSCYIFIMAGFFFFSLLFWVVGVGLVWEVIHSEITTLKTEFHITS